MLVIGTHVLPIPLLFNQEKVGSGRELEVGVVPESEREPDSESGSDSGSGGGEPEEEPVAVAECRAEAELEAACEFGSTPGTWSG